MEKIPCIFGPKIHYNCPVREELRKPNISRWTKPQDERLEDIANVVTLMMKQELLTLATFCRCCPFLRKYIKKEDQK